MAKVKGAGSTTRFQKKDAKGLISCGFLVVVGLGLIFWMMWASMSAGK